MKYSTFEKMHTLWLQYIEMVLQVRPAEAKDGLNVKDCSVQNSLCSRIVKADYSGAKVKVVKSKNPATLDIEGIIVRETTRTFIVI